MNYNFVIIILCEISKMQGFCARKQDRPFLDHSLQNTANIAPNCSHQYMIFMASPHTHRLMIYIMTRNKKTSAQRVHYRVHCYSYLLWFLRRF